MSHVDFKTWQCRMSLSLLLVYPMSHVEFKNRLCHMSLQFLGRCRMSLSPMAHVEFKKCPCRPVNFRGQGPRK